MTTSSEPERGAHLTPRRAPAFLQRTGGSPYHRLNPLTKSVAATVTALNAMIIGGLAGPVILTVAAVVVPAAIAGVLRPLARTALLLTLPIALSVLLVNVFFFPGARDVLLEIGPLRATREGLSLALEILARLFAISGALTLFYLTTTPAAVIADLERRGTSRTLAFVALASVQAVPAMVHRAATITAAQRARGLDTEGNPWRRIRGVLPVVAPVVLGSLSDVEDRTLALEARGFGRPGPRSLLWTPPDSPAQQVARRLILLSVPFLLVLRVAGVLR